MDIENCQWITTDKRFNPFLNYNKSVADNFENTGKHAKKV